MAEQEDRSDNGGLLAELIAATTFLTIVPQRAGRGAGATAPALAHAARMFPVVGAGIGLVGGLVLLLADRLGLPLIAAATVSVAATMVITGLLHEDGLADTADGFGGDGPARRLEIMRDHHIGTFGTAALIVTTLLRVALLTELAFANIVAAILVLIGAEVGARAALVRVWHGVPPARTDGLSASAGQPDGTTALIAAAVGVVVAFLVLVHPIGLIGALVTIGGSAAVALAFGELCRHQFGGQTGDILGATEQLTLVTFLAIAAIMV